MSSKKENLLIFFIQILCFLAVPARGQQALDKTIQSNVEFESVKFYDTRIVEKQ